MNNPIDLRQMLKAKTSEINLNQKFSNLKLSRDKRNNSGNELKKSKLLKFETTSRKVQEPMTGSKVPSKTNPILRESILKYREPKEKQRNMMCYQKKIGAQTGDHKKTLENMAKIKFDNPDEPQPIHYDSKLAFDIGDTIKNPNILQPHALITCPDIVKMSYNDCHLVNVLHTKVLAHSNGFFANSLPSWYEKTFGKILPTNWLDLLKYSQKFSVEQLQNKVVIYAVEEDIQKSSG